jgi:hypothetical protein
VHVMQYDIGLPADYDMVTIEHRVATRGSATDEFPHLGLKAYAVRRIGRHGSAVNAYAPFYLWRDPAGMNAFLYGPFENITRDFGRPPVRHWVGVAFHRGAEIDAVPVFATRETRPLPPDGAPGAAVERAVVDVEHADGMHSTAVAVDPLRWEVVRYVLWSRVPDGWDPETTPFDVLHASTPELADLPTGRLW